MGKLHYIKKDTVLSLSELSKVIHSDRPTPLRHIGYSGSDKLLCGLLFNERTTYCVSCKFARCLYDFQKEGWCFDCLLEFMKPTYEHPSYDQLKPIDYGIRLV